MATNSTGQDAPEIEDDGATPQAIFNTLNGEFNFTVDALATPEKALCERFFTGEQNALAQDWHSETVWSTVPNAASGLFIAKAATAASKGATVVLLIAARPDTKAWHSHIFGNCFCEIRFIKGRVKYAGAAKGAPYPSAIVIFRPPASLHSAHLKVGAFILNTKPKTKKNTMQSEDEEFWKKQISLETVWKDE